jgi:pimeloyl-ACP methyl ester carboxylesterase
LPGFPGAEGHEDLDSLLDWITVTLDILDATNLTGCDLAASSVGAMLALEVAALSPAAVNRLALMAPLGLYSDHWPVPHIWARRSADMLALLANDKEELSRLQAVPDGADPVEWNLVLSRATAAGARLLWPMCELGLHHRLHRVRQPTLLVWGNEDQIVRPEYASLFAAAIAGPVETVTIPNAGHLVELDAPREAAASITRFLRE